MMNKASQEKSGGAFFMQESEVALCQENRNGHVVIRAALRFARTESNTARNTENLKSSIMKSSGVAILPADATAEPGKESATDI